MELVVIEQLLLLLPSRTRHWLACWRPERLLDFLELWENCLATEGHEIHTRRDGGQGRGGGPSQLSRLTLDPNVR